MDNKPNVTDRFLGTCFRRRLRGFLRLWGLSGRDTHATIRAISSKGPVFELSPFSYIDSIVLRSGYYESEVIDAILSELSDGVLWDIGADFGLHGLTAKFQRRESRVVCFEPSVAMLGRLCRNCALNDLEVEIVGVALSNRTGFQTLFVGPDGNPGMSTLSPWSGASYSGSQLVAVFRGDDLLEQGLIARPTVIKLDVEGHELSVLEGMPKTLNLPSLRAVVFEDSSDNGSEVKKLLRDAGFECAVLLRRENSAHLLENFIARRSPHV